MWVRIPIANLEFFIVENSIYYCFGSELHIFNIHGEKFHWNLVLKSFERPISIWCKLKIQRFPSWPFYYNKVSENIDSRFMSNKKEFCIFILIFRSPSGSRTIIDCSCSAPWSSMLIFRYSIQIFLLFLISQNLYLRDL